MGGYVGDSSFFFMSMRDSALRSAKREARADGSRLKVETVPLSNLVTDPNPPLNWGGSGPGETNKGGKDVSWNENVSSQGGGGVKVDRVERWRERRLTIVCDVLWVVDRVRGWDVANRRARGPQRGFSGPRGGHQRQGQASFKNWS